MSHQVWFTCRIAPPRLEMATPLAMTSMAFVYIERSWPSVTFVCRREKLSRRSCSMMYWCMSSQMLTMKNTAPTLTPCCPPSREAKSTWHANTSATCAA